MSPKPTHKYSLLAYKVLAALLYPRSAMVQATSWEGRVFYLTPLAKHCNTTVTRMKGQLEYLRQAGFLLSVEYHKEPGPSGKHWGKSVLLMPTNRDTK